PRRRVGGDQRRPGIARQAARPVRGPESRGPRRRTLPPHYKKQQDEPPRVAPSRMKSASAGQGANATTTGSGHRRPTHPLITVARAKHKEDAFAGLERWKARHPAAAAMLQVDDILVDSMRGRSSTWTRIRVNLRHVPESERSSEEPPDPDYDPWRGSDPGPRAPKTSSSS